jgi:hypothetical protein
MWKGWAANTGAGGEERNMQKVLIKGRQGLRI